MVTSNINPYLRNFFFMGFKSKRQYKDAEKAIGKIKTISIILTDERSFMRAESETERHDTDMTIDEKQQLLKTFKVKQEYIDESKRIFVLLDMENKKIHIRQTKKDGTKKEFEI